MPDIIKAKLKNHSSLALSATTDILYEIRDYFSFRKKGYQYNPKFKAGVWDGYLRAFDIRDRTIPSGLIDRLKEFTSHPGRDYELQLEESEWFGLPGAKDEIDLEELFAFIKDLKPVRDDGTPIEIYDYQFAAIFDALTTKRRLIISPTATGKSFIIYCIMRWWLEKHHEDGDKFVLIVPTTLLVNQMYGDFEDYSRANGWSVEDNCHMLYSGKEKISSKPILISTWQSLCKFNQQFFGTVKAIVGDEVHEYAADTVQGIMKSCINADRRWGTTGTLDDAQCSEMSLVGAFGEKLQVTTTKEQIENGRLSQLAVSAIRLKYPKEERRGFRKRYKDYNAEVGFIELHKGRMSFLTNMVSGLTGNTIVLFRHQEHGRAIYNALIEAGIKAYYIDGTVDAEDRDKYRREINSSTGCVLVGSYQTCSTGMNIRNLQNLIFAAPHKGIVKILQSIGRILRLSDDGSAAHVYDIIDDIAAGKTPNHALRHGQIRLEIYATQEFDYTVFDVNLEKPFE